MKRRFGIYSVLAVLTLGLLGSVMPASASVKGRRNAALALSGAAVYELARGHTATGLVLGGGSYYAWHRVKQAKHHRVHRYRHVAYRHHYRHVASRHHHHRSYA